MAKSRKKAEPPPAAPERAGPQASGDTTAAAVDRERIARRAYELYLQRGGADGEAMADWLAAERELVGARDTSQE